LLRESNKEGVYRTKQVRADVIRELHTCIIVLEFGVWGWRLVSPSISLH